MIYKLLFWTYIGSLSILEQYIKRSRMLFYIYRTHIDSIMMIIDHFVRNLKFPSYIIERRKDYKTCPLTLLYTCYKTSFAMRYVTVYTY